MECYRSKRKLLGLLILTAALVAMFCFLATMPDAIAKVVGWVGLAFFGLGFIAIPVMFFRTGPLVVINNEGIDDRRTKIGVIRWEDIRSVSIGSVKSARFLCIDLYDPEKYLSRLPRWTRSLATANKALGFPALTISFSGLTPGLEEVWAYLDGRVPRAILYPEGRFVVTVSESEIVCQRPDGIEERVSWNELQKIEVVTTSEGPSLPDVFWVLHGARGGCVVPQGAIGDGPLLERLQKLPGFDNGAVIEAMTSTSDRRFLCWQKQA